MSIFVLIANYGSSQNNIDSLKIELKNPKSSYNEINTLLIIGKEYCDINTDSAFLYINKADDKLKENPYPFLNGTYHKVYGQYLNRVNKYNSAITEYKTAINYYTELDSISYIPVLYNFIASCFENLFEYDSSLSYFQLSVQLTDTVKNPLLQASNYNNVAIVYNQINQPAKALINYFNALAIFRRLNQFKQAAVTLHNIGGVNLDLGNTEKAIVCFEEAIKYNKESGDIYNLCMSYNSIGTTYKDLSDYKKARYYLMEAIKLAENARFVELVARSSANLGLVYMRALEFDSALFFYNKSLAICIENGIIHGEIINYTNIGEVYMKMGQYHDAETYFSKALELSNTSNISSYLIDIYKLIFEVYSLSGNYKKSVDFHNLYNKLRDSLDIIENTRQLNELQTKYETEQKELENQQLKDKNKINELIILRQRIVVVAISLLVILTIVIILLLIIAKTKRKKRLALLEEKNKQIEDKSLQLKESNETKDRLFSIIAHDLRSPFTSLLGFSSLLNEEVESDNYSNVKSYSKHLLNISNSAYELVDNLLNWARLQQAIIKPEITSISLNKLAKDTIRALIPKAEEKHITIEISVNPETKVDSDVNMLMVVLRNLISNALKFTPKNGKIEIGCNKKTNHYEISVKDNGTGISPKIKEKLFKNKNNLTTSGTDGESGSGLGLLLVKDFVNKLGGDIWIDSKPNEGSTFIFTIPKTKSNT